MKFLIIEGAYKPTQVTTLYMHATLTNFIADISYHSPILMQLANRVRSKVKKQLTIENAWLKEEDIPEVVLNDWNQSFGMLHLKAQMMIKEEHFYDRIRKSMNCYEPIKLLQHMPNVRKLDTVFFFCQKKKNKVVF